MNRKTTGALLMAAGALLVVISGLLFLGNEDDATAETSSTTNAASIPTTTVEQTAPTTTDASVTTTTTLATTTTTVDGVALVSLFIQQFSTAISEGDSEFIFSRLHPDIVEGFGPDICETWVNNQIMGLSNYIATSLPQGPTMGTLQTPGGTIAFDNRYTSDVSFEFGGQQFDSTADFVVEATTVYFTGSCAT